MATEPRDLTDEQRAELKLLELANNKGKFAIQTGYEFEPALRFAFERGLDNDWFTLIDIDMLAGRAPATVTFPGGSVSTPLMKIYRLTPAGLQRRSELRGLS